MTVASFGSSSFRVAVVGGAPDVVVTDALVGAPDARALSAALGWMRTREFLAPAAESADQVLALRAIQWLVDEMDVIAGASPGAPVTLTQAQVALLAEATARCLADRADGEGYVPPAERERLERLRVLADRLFGLSADFAGAVAELAHRQPH